MTSDLAEGEIEFDLEKSSYFRVIHVDGVVGAVSPGNGFIHMSVFSERAPVPRKMVHAISGGVLGREYIEKRVVRPGAPFAFREVEADLVFNMETATELRDWLDEKINEIQKLQPQTYPALRKEPQT